MSEDTPNLPKSVGCINQGGADLVLRNGHIITMDGVGQAVNAMAVRDGRILSLGDYETVSGYISSGTRVLDLHGNTVLPGLIDVHTHVMQWAKTILRGEIDAGHNAVRSIPEIVKAVAERTVTIPHRQWIRGSGWDDDKFAERRYITRHDLDPVSLSHPVYLAHVSGHLAALNSVALRIAGITRDTRDPQGGVIERDPAGEPTGIVKDTAMDPIVALLPEDPPDIYARAAKLISERAAELGLTTIHDIYITPDEMRGYQEARRRGWLTVRIQMSPCLGNLSDAEALARMGVSTGFGDDLLKFGAVKMFADGGMGARTITGQEAGAT